MILNHVKIDVCFFVSFYIKDKIIQENLLIKLVKGSVIVMLGNSML